MQAFIVVSDYAQRDPQTGKVHMVGGDWTVAGPALTPMSVTVFLRVPWEEVNVPRKFRLTLLDESGNPVELEDEGPIEFGGLMGNKTPARVPDDETARMADIHNSLVVNLGPLPLAAGSPYTWSFEVDDQQLASTRFSLRPADA